MKCYVEKKYLLFSFLLPILLISWEVAGLYRGREFSFAPIAMDVLVLTSWGYLVYKASVAPVIEISKKGISVFKRTVEWSLISRVNYSYFGECKLIITEGKNMLLPVDLISKHEKEKLLKEIRNHILN